jgi:hypothetical protein
LLRTIVKLKRSLAIRDDLPPQSMPDPTTLDDLKQRLAALPAGASFSLRAADYVKLFEGGATDAWAGSPALGDECQCSVEFRPGGMVWFVKRLI